MKRLVKYVYIFSSIIFLAYLVIPNQEFPEQLSDSIQSFEPADVETPLRRGYYTDMTREQVMEHYVKQVEKSEVVGLRLLTYRLNYPPEEAQVLIRDQARSTFLEEIVHPFRESFYINGYEPKEDKDLIQIDGRYWRQKVIVRHVSSNVVVRFIAGVVVLMFTPQLFSKWKDFIKSFKGGTKK